MDTSEQRSSYVLEHDDAFLKLWPHRYDYIWADYPNPNEKPHWQTESRHPLSDRLIQQGSYLYGVRFGTQTQYCLLDIDVGSVYHPHHDPLAIGRITEALEPLGLVSAIVCTSSYSQGLHLYFPFEIAQNSWQLSSVVTALLESQGFQCQPGQLEVFPNSKLYVIDGTPSLFNAHRLPLQVGSYLLNTQLEPVKSGHHNFIKQWLQCQQRNSVDADTLQSLLQQIRRHRHRVSQRADKFLNDLNAEIELGWTGKGQTNYLLGRITMRAYIFNHVIFGGLPLDGKALIETIVTVAQSLPGYREWCNHQHEIHQRAAEWARCIENSHYFPYGTQKGKYKAKNHPSSGVVEKTWNEQRAQTAQDRICAATADLLAIKELPTTATARFRKLLEYGIGGGTLYKYKELWHPALWKTPQTPQASKKEAASATASPATATYPLSLLSSNDSNPLQGNDLNLLEAAIEGQAVRNEEAPKPWRQLKLDLKARRSWQKQAARSQKEAHLHSKARQEHQAHRDKMVAYLQSGDPILMREGWRWLSRQQDGTLEILSSSKSGKKVSL